MSAIRFGTTYNFSNFPKEAVKPGAIIKVDVPRDRFDESKPFGTMLFEVKANVDNELWGLPLTNINATKASTFDVIG